MWSLSLVLIRLGLLRGAALSDRQSDEEAAGISFESQDNGESDTISARLTD